MKFAQEKGIRLSIIIIANAIAYYLSIG